VVQCLPISVVHGPFTTGISNCQNIIFSFCNNSNILLISTIFHLGSYKKPNVRYKKMLYDVMKPFSVTKFHKMWPAQDFFSTFGGPQSSLSLTCLLYNIKEIFHQGNIILHYVIFVISHGNLNHRGSVVWESLYSSLWQRFSTQTTPRPVFLTKKIPRPAIEKLKK